MAVGPPVRLGVDLELLRDGWEDVAPLLATAEQAFIATRAPTEQRKAFYHVWTRKEAYLKAIGRGLEVAPCSFSVVPGATETEALDNDSWQTATFQLAESEALLTVVAECDELTVAIAQYDLPSYRDAPAGALREAPFGGIA
ncbi:MAG: 4'-phosphopantetheinyl transferase family protein [Ktedonobacterales bacterium]